MKRLICLFDGTWDRPRDSRAATNVVKLHRAILPTDTNGVRQLARYEIGIATDSTGFESFVMGAIGADVGARVQSAYRFICETYEPDDEVYAFGFSRGAFEARSLLGLIALSGVLKRDALDKIDEAWNCYALNKINPDSGRLHRARAHAHYPVRVKCAGVWETVGNLGIPLVALSGFNRQFAFHDTRLTGSVDVALQALAIDEPRGPFSPTFWTRAKGEPAPEDQIVEQVWFAGSHANVGGGFEDSSLSDIALLWMAERVGETTGLALDWDGLRETAAPNAYGNQVMPTSGIYRVSGWFPFIRLIQQNARAIPRWRRMMMGTWRSSTLPRGERSINETIHPSVMQRFGRTVTMIRGGEPSHAPYRPRNLTVVLARKSRRLKERVETPAPV